MELRSFWKPGNSFVGISITIGKIISMKVNFQIKKTIYNLVQLIVKNNKSTMVSIKMNQLFIIRIRQERLIHFQKRDLVTPASYQKIRRSSLLVDYIKMISINIERNKRNRKKNRSKSNNQRNVHLNQEPITIDLGLPVKIR